MINWDQPQGYKPDGLGMTETELQEQIKLLPIKIANSEEDRANPNHSQKDGKFTSGHGGGSGKELQGWKYETLDERKSGRLAKFEKAKGAPLTESEKQDILDGMPRSKQLLRSPDGHISLLDTSSNGIPRSDFESLGKHADKLQADFPISDQFGSSVSVRVVKSNDIMQDLPASIKVDKDQYVAGDTVRGTGSIRLNERVYENTKPNAAGDTWAMPSSTKVDQPTYILHHEWGHATDKHSDSEVTKALEDFGGGGLSEYGKSSPREAYAEAFAEWTLSKGATSNKAAKDYAERFKWKAPK